MHNIFLLIIYRDVNNIIITSCVHVLYVLDERNKSNTAQSFASSLVLHVADRYRIYLYFYCFNDKSLRETDEHSMNNKCSLVLVMALIESYLGTQHMNLTFMSS